MELLSVRPDLWNVIMPDYLLALKVLISSSVSKMDTFGVSLTFCTDSFDRPGETEPYAALSSVFSNCSKNIGFYANLS